MARHVEGRPCRAGHVRVSRDATGGVTHGSRTATSRTRPQGARLLFFARLLLYFGATLAIGNVALRAFAVFDVGGATPHRARAGARNGAAAFIELRYAWLALWAACALLLLLQARAMEIGFDVGGIADVLTGTTWGRGWTTLLGAVAIANIAYGAGSRVALQAVTISAMAVAMGGLGHAAADDAWPVTSRVLDGLHVLGVGGWIGGLYLVWRYAPHEHQSYVWGTFSRLATLAAPIVLLTGVGSALRRLVGLDLAVTLSGTYGRLLLAKIGVVAIVLALGAMHRRRTRESYRPGVSTVRAELFLAIAVLVITSVLTGTSPE